ncbi:MAG: hypothetical protein JAY90_21860 [Candidatus Thiodiazotropha lotti]|nr:hypothetical protein [Candidatus Thiodiazotropha lotti]
MIAVILLILEPITEASCSGGGGCLGLIRDKLTQPPKFKKHEVEYNWPDSNGADNELYRFKISDLNVGAELLSEFDEIPREIQEAVDEAENAINSVQEQVDELEQRAQEYAEEADDWLDSVPGYKHLKDATKKAIKKYEEIKEKAEEVASEAADQIPEFTLVCDD